MKKIIENEMHTHFALFVTLSKIQSWFLIVTDLYALYGVYFLGIMDSI